MCVLYFGWPNRIIGLIGHLRLQPLFQDESTCELFVMMILKLELINIANLRTLTRFERDGYISLIFVLG